MSRKNVKMKNMYLFGALAPWYRPVLLSPSALSRSYFCSSSCSSLIHLPSPSQQTPVDGKEGQRRCQRKNNKHLTINRILLFVIPNLGSVARNGDGGETTDNGQRETKRRGRKHEDPAELTFVYIDCCFIVVVSSVSKVDSEGTIDAIVFRTIKIPHLNLSQSGLFLPRWMNSTKNNLVKQKGKFQIEVGSIKRFDKCSRVMESCACDIARNANSNGRFSGKIKSQL